jgi:hypothetical protein
MTEAIVCDVCKETDMEKEDEVFNIFITKTKGLGGLNGRDGQNLYTVGMCKKCFYVMAGFLSEAAIIFNKDDIKRSDILAECLHQINTELMCVKSDQPLKDE